MAVVVVLPCVPATAMPVLVFHELAQEVCPPENGDARRQRRLHLDVAVRDRRGAHNPVGSAGRSQRHGGREDCTPAACKSAANGLMVISEPVTVYPLSLSMRAMADSPLPPIPMKCTCSSSFNSFLLWQLSNSQLLNYPTMLLYVDHDHKDETQDDGKVDARFAQELRRHVRHQVWTAACGLRRGAARCSGRR